MQLQFKEQQFQTDAVSAVVNCFAGQPAKTNRFTLERSAALIQKAKQAAAGVATFGFENEILEEIGYRNSPLAVTEAQILQNIQQVQRQNDIPESKQLERVKNQRQGINLTVEMETGTGKTYTYIRTMYELNKKYGWSKFIIIVPSIAIREGVYKSFEITQTHFQQLYNHKIVPFIYNSSRPQDIESFASNPRISVMIINTQAFNARGADARRIYMELDHFGTRKPIEIIAQTNPILIIDEPQSVDGDATLKSMQDFNPLLTLRYSATHKVEYNKVYRLDALDAYNKKLVKKIQVKGISLKGTTGTNGYLYLEQIVLSKTKAPVALIEFEKRNANNEAKRVRQKVEKGANLFELSGQMQQYQHYTIQEIDGYHNKIVLNGADIFAGEVVGDYYETDFRRIQIRETIISHLNKEKQLFDKGIKVLSLFFIDSVDKYRVYDKDGNETTGEYARIFEEEYNKVRNDYIDLFQQEYNEFLHNTDPGRVHKGYLPSNYQKYLERDAAEKIHNGYFSIDKKNKLVDPETKKGKKGEEANSDDISAYDLIMKDKERLLSFDEPTRFIFSHSALKEGWDNPNVFQICALKHNEGAATRRRQEVGRGMRLCVNEDGIRLDYDSIGEQVHEINRLTVIASESYEEFAKGLQSEIAETLQSRPQKIEVKLFIDKVLTNEKGEQLRLDDFQANLLNNTLMYERIADINGKITDTGKTLIEENKVPLPPALEPFRTDIHKLLKTVYTGEPFGVENERDKTPVTVNKNFYKEEFKALWEKINIKSIYEVQFNTEKLIEDSKNRINADLYIADRSYEVKEGVLEQTTKEKIENNEAIRMLDRTNKKLSTDVYTETTYDIVGEIVAITNLKRLTITEILKKISPQKFLLIRKNPEEFIAKCSKLINEVKASLIYNNIVYHKIDETHDAKTVFTNTKEALRNAELLKKHIYDFIITDSNTEKSFAKALDDSAEVTVYAKLPRNFYITTPVANYSPDWAIVFDKEKVRHIYFVAETKGSDSDLELREIEKLKLHCAEEHFKAISNQEVIFKKVSSYEKLLEIVQLKQ